MNSGQYGELMESLLHHCVGVWVIKCGTYLIPKVTADVKLTNEWCGWVGGILHARSESLKRKAGKATKNDRVKRQSKHVYNCVCVRVCVA